MSGPDQLLDVEHGGEATITQGKDAYLINDEHYDRISAAIAIIAKPGIEAWKRKVGFIKADEIMRESSILGKEVHGICEEYNRGQDPIGGFWLEESGKPPRWVEVRGTRLEPYLIGYDRWFRRYVRRIIMIERTVWSPTDGYAGTFDTFAELKGETHGGKLALLDNKTSKYLSWTYRLQTAAYKRAALELDLIPDVDLRGIVFLSSKTPGTCELVPYDEEKYPRELRAWYGALDNYRMSLEYEDDWKQRGPAAADR